MYVVKKLRKNPHKNVVIASPKDLFARVGYRAGSGATTSNDPDKCPVVPINGRKIDYLASADAMDAYDLRQAEIAVKQANSASPETEHNEPASDAE